MEKGKNAGCQHFLLFPQYFHEASSSDLLKLGIQQILDWSKLKAFADDKINVTEKFKFVSKRIKNILGKGENAG